MPHTNSQHPIEEIISGVELTTEEDTRLAREIDEDTGEILSSIMPYYADDSAATAYMGYRGSGFSKTEALDLVQRDRRTLYNWYRKDPNLKLHDNEGLSDFREKVGRNFAYADFMRNFRMIMQKDFRILNKSLRHPENMDTEESRYLRTIRSQYSPTNLDAITQYMKGEAIGNSSGNIFIQILQDIAADGGVKIKSIDSHERKAAKGIIDGELADNLQEARALDLAEAEIRASREREESFSNTEGP